MDGMTLLRRAHDAGLVGRGSRRQALDPRSQARRKYPRCVSAIVVPRIRTWPPPSDKFLSRKVG
jgi:hypothetical protein